MDADDPADERAPVDDPPISTNVTPPESPHPAAPQNASQPADSGRHAALILGVILLMVGLWFFATHTLGFNLPRLDREVLWPLALIGLGAWIVLRAFGQRSS